MKKNSLYLVTLLIFNSGISQNIEIQNKEYYLQKRKTNMTAGWFCLGIGVVGIAGGVALDFSDNFLNGGSYNNTGLTLAYVGGGLVLTSIPLFAAANKNKKKAANATLSIKNEHCPNQNLTLSNHQTIALTIEF